ncbi:metallophosphoesterase [Microbacterium lacus]|uniref:metallophosphoesterase n=1 Tax=Microbacterium lacus TaxID=415217 RepID=UPI001E45AF26|nr:metallophosphoesterase [Microbacterium lacus]
MTPRSRQGLRALAVAGALGAAAAVWGIGVERYLFTLRRVELAILPPGSTPVRVLHISDVHMAPWQRRKQAWIASLASLRPDLIINTGDNMGHVDGLRGVRAAFAGFRGTPGFFVLGSNDNFGPTPRNPLRYFLGPSRRKRNPPRLDVVAMQNYFTENLGWTNLDNAAGSVDVAGLRVNGFGVGDAHHDDDRLDLVPGMVESLHTDANTSNELTIGVAHAPYRRVLDTFTDAGAEAIFAGHTHGGQVRLPGFGALVANCDIPLKQARGLSTWARRGRTVPLNVSAGLGHSIYAPVRFACRPEATLVTLIARA